MDNNFTLFCISNGSESEFPENTLTSFKNKLPLSLNIKKTEHSKWCMAIESICFSTLFGNVRWPWGPSFITVSLDYVDNRLRHVYRQLEALRVERKSVCMGFDRANFAYRDSEIRDKLRRGKSKYPGEEKTYHLYSLRAMREYMPDIHYYYPDDFYCDLESLGKYFENMSKNNNMVITRTATSIEIIPSPRLELIENWFLINTKLIYNGPFKLDIEYHSLAFMENHRGKTSFHHTSDVKIIEANLIEIGDEFYKAFFMSCLIKKLTLTLVKTEPELYIPKIIKVRCENAKHQIFNGEYSKDLAIFCPSLKPNDNFFYKEFDSKQFIPISNTTLNHIDIKLLDQSNDFIKLTDGYATIVKLHLRKMPDHKKFFNVRITSQKSVLYKDNTKNNFKVSLPNTLNFNSRWKVSVTSINHPTIFNTFPADSKIKMILTDGKIYSYTLKEKYETVEELIEDMNKLFSTHKLLKATYQILERRLIKTIRFTILKDCVFIIPQEVANVFGSTKTGNESGVAWLVKVKAAYNQPGVFNFDIDMENTVDLDFYKPNYVMMYSNIVSPTIVGGEFQNILKVFPIPTDKKTEYQIQEFKHYEYHNLSNYEIKDIEISFRSHSGDKVFFGGKYDVIVNLLFTNYEEHD